MSKKCLLVAILSLAAIRTVRANPLDDLRARLHGKPAATAPTPGQPTDDQAQTDSSGSAGGSTGSGAVDVAGIKPGMSYSQVAHILMAKDPKAQGNLKGSGIINWQSSTVKNGTIAKSETFSVTFTDTNHAWMIDRTVINAGGFIYGNILKQLDSKWGPERYAGSAIGADMYWTLNDDGTPGADCEAYNKGKRYACPPIVILADMRKIDPASVNTTVLQSVKVTLMDSTVLNAGLAVAKAKRDADTAVKNKQATDQASKNTAAF
jgi:hypothetical protein